MWTYCKAKCCRAFGQTGNDYRKKNNIMLTFYNKLSQYVNMIVTSHLFPSATHHWKCFNIHSEPQPPRLCRNLLANNLLLQNKILKIPIMTLLLVISALCFFRKLPRPNPCTI